MCRPRVPSPVVVLGRGCVERLGVGWTRVWAVTTQRHQSKCLLGAEPRGGYGRCYRN